MLDLVDLSPQGDPTNTANMLSEKRPVIEVTQTWVISLQTWTTRAPVLGPESLEGSVLGGVQGAKGTFLPRAQAPPRPHFGYEGPRISCPKRPQHPSGAPSPGLPSQGWTPGLLA